MAMKHTLFEKKTFEHFIKPGEVTEIRVLGAFGNSGAWSGFAKGTVAGWFDDHASLCKAVTAINGEKVNHGGAYFTPQVIDPRLIGRAFNRLVVAKETTADRDVRAYRFLLIDADPVRPAGISSSDAELAAALKLRDEIAGEIASDYHLPEPICAISGNGGHLLYPLPDPPAVKYGPIIKKMLEAISVKFSTDLVTIDSRVFNPARIWKLYGTIARKGDEVPAGPNREARPHRLAFIDRLPVQEVSE
jgi:hypothetical protein